MKGTSIVVTSPPKGHFEEGIISGTPKPGQFMEIVPNVAPIGGCFTWRVSSKTTGNTRMVVILREDALQGKTYADAYVSGSRCFLYFPLVGEECNVLTAAEAGTGSADAFHIGDDLGISSTGFAVPNSSYTSTPWLVLEHIVQSPADTPTLVWSKRQ